MDVNSQMLVRGAALCALSIAGMSACDGPPSSSSTEVRGELDRYALETPASGAERTEIMVLGTYHLASLGDAFSDDILSPLLDRLEAFDPDVVAVESLPPSEIRRLVGAADESESAALIVESFAGEVVRWGEAARAHTNSTAVEAIGAAEATISTATMPDAGTRRRLALQFLAADDLPSALLHWVYLPSEERRSDGTVPADVAEFLTARLGAVDERTAIGVELARRLGLQRVASIDDHVDDEIGLETGLNVQLMAELQETAAFEELVASGYLDEPRERLSEAVALGDALPSYRRLNSLEHLNADVDAQWHLFHRTELESGLDRARAALWEARNLHIAARIREVSAHHPGGRMLVVIGAAHKPFLDRYLAQMMDVDVVNTADVLGGSEAVATDDPGAR